MKKLALLFLAIACTTLAFAQEKTDTTARYNQYGVKVNREPLHCEQRNNIIVFESKSGDYKFWMDNRVQVDFATFLGEKSYYDKIGNGARIRRARFAVKAQITPAWYGEVDMDVAGGNFELKDAIIEYDGLKNFAFKAGNFKENFSMEETTTSRYLMFLERADVVNAFAPSRHLGIQAKYNTSNDKLFVSAGVGFQAIEDSEIATNVDDNNKDYGRNQGYSFTGKIGYNVMTNLTKTRGIYLGVDGQWSTPKTDVAVGDYKTVRYSTRNATSINRKKYLDTDCIPNVNHTVIYGFEGAAYWDGFRMQAEYIGNHTTAKANSYNFGGFYVQAGYMLFGGKQQFNTGDGEFTQPSRGHKWGDLELSARYDYLDLNSKDIFGGSGQNTTVGLTFYVNNAVKFCFNYIYTDTDRYANGKGKLIVGHDATGTPTADYTKVVESKGKAGVKYSTLSLRMEIDF